MKLFVLFLLISFVNGRLYKPTWDSLDNRPLPRWYDEAKVGVLVHWGVYSVPSCCGATQWFWANWKHGQENVVNYVKQNYPPGFTYLDFGPQFTAEFFDPRAWAQLFKDAGAKYVIVTSKSHDGFTLFPSTLATSWNSVDVGPHRDLVGELSEAVKGEGINFGVYYSLTETYNPIFVNDKSANFETHAYRDNKLLPEITQLVTNYTPSIIWADGHWEAPDTYFNSTQLLAWLYNESPVKNEVVVNDRWGKNTPCKHGDFHNCRNEHNPGKIQKHKWESFHSLDKLSLGYRRDMTLQDVTSLHQLIRKMVTAVSCGGNFLINVGATKEGTIPLLFEERLLALGQWLNVNGEAIYGTSPWLHQAETINKDVWYTCKKTTYNAQRPTALPTMANNVEAVFAVILEWPESNLLKLRDITEFHNADFDIEMLGYDDKILEWSVYQDEIQIQLPAKSKVKSKFAWTLKFITNLKTFTKIN